MKAALLLKNNLDTLLRGRHQSRKDLAMWCHRSESWLSQIFTDPEREVPLKYLDRIADFFGVATYQLFQPGVSAITERRHADRRSGRDRRLSRATINALPTDLSNAEIGLVAKLRAVAVRDRAEFEKLVEDVYRLPKTDQSSRGRAPDAPGSALEASAPRRRRRR